jgi:hypothetical protein
VGRVGRTARGRFGVHLLFGAANEGFPLLDALQLSPKLGAHLDTHQHQEKKGRRREKVKRGKTTFCPARDTDDTDNTSRFFVVVKHPQ